MLSASEKGEVGMRYGRKVDLFSKSGTGAKHLQPPFKRALQVLMASALPFLRDEPQGTSRLFREADTSLWDPAADPGAYVYRRSRITQIQPGHRPCRS